MSWAASLALCAGLASGCSDADPAGGEPGTTLGREDLSEQIAQWRCDGFAQCCGTAGIEFDRETCLDVQGDKRLQSWVRQETETVQFDGTEAVTCAAALRATEPRCPPRLPDECNDVLDGTVEIGGECRTSRDCRGRRDRSVACLLNRCMERLPPGADCAPICNDEGRCTSTCNRCRKGSKCLQDELGNRVCVAVEARRVGEGEPCGRASGPVAEGVVHIEDLDCEPGFWCAPEQKVCRSAAGPGERCPLLVPCAEGLACIDDVCVEPAIGDPCMRDSDCGSERRCYDGECGSRIVAGPGEPCPPPIECEEGSRCHLDRYLCVADAELGEACGGTAGSYRACRSPLVCQGRSGPDGYAGECVTGDTARCVRAFVRPAPIEEGL